MPTHEIRPLQPDQARTLLDAVRLHRLLDGIFLALNRIGDVPAYTYGIVWLLEDELSGRRYDDIGIEYCRTRGLVPDDRAIGTAGIRSGDKLRVVRLNDSRANKRLQATSRVSSPEKRKGRALRG